MLVAFIYYISYPRPWQCYWLSQQQRIWIWVRTSSNWWMMVLPVRSGKLITRACLDIFEHCGVQFCRPAHSWRWLCLNKKWTNPYGCTQHSWRCPGGGCTKQSVHPLTILKRGSLWFSTPWEAANLAFWLPDIYYFKLFGTTLLFYLNYYIFLISHLLY